MPNKQPKFTAFDGNIFYHWYQSPIGKLLLTGNESALFSISFPNHNAITADQWHENIAPFKDICAQLDSYFNRELTTFDIALAPKGTEFQQSVWQALLEIPYGETTSYGAIAKRLDNPKAVRAVGGANGRNPIPIIIPCHRVIGSNGSLTGFGGGLPTKTYLLDLENSEQLELPF